MDKQLLLYNYFSNQLSSEQERLFNELLATDAEFKQQFDFENDLKRMIREKEAIDLKSKLRGFEKDISKDVPDTISHRSDYRKWAIAASIVLLIGLGWLGYRNSAGPDYDGLYNENFRQYPNTVYAITRGGDSDGSLERKAFVAYETDDNANAIALFEKLMETDDSEDTTFYLAQAYLKNDQPEEAIPLLNRIVQDKGEFAPQALWYVALAHLKTAQEKQAIKALEALIADGRYKKDEASKLLETLE